MSKIVFDFMGEASHDFLSGLGSNVITNMTGNTNFPGSDPLVATVTTDYKSMTLAEAAAKSGSAGDRILARQAKATFQKSMNALSRFLNGATDSRLLLLTTGFNLSKDTRTTSVLGAITNFEATAGFDPNTLDVSFKRPAGMQSGGFEWSTDGTMWIPVILGNVCSAIITGVPAGVPVTVRAYATGSYNQKVVSVTVTTYANFISARKRA